MVKASRDHQLASPTEPEPPSNFRTVFDHCPDAIFLIDAESGIITDVNQAACELMGMPREELMGLHQSQLHPEGQQEIYEAIIREQAIKEEAITQDLYVRRSSGELVPVDISASVLEISGKGIVQCVFRDTSERKEAELRRRSDQLAALNAIAIGVTGTLDMQQVFHTIQEHVVTLLDEKYPPLFTLFDEADQTFKVMVTGRHQRLLEVVDKLLGLKLQEFTVPLSTLEPHLREALLAGEPYVSTDPSNMLTHLRGAPVRAVQRALGVNCVVNLPLSVKGKLVGSIVLFSQKESLSNGQMGLLTSVASQAAVAVDNARLYEAAQQELTERKQAEDALRESEAKYSAVVEQARDAIVIVQDGICKFANRATVDLFGYPLEDTIGVPFLERVAPQSKEVIAQRYEKRMAGLQVPSIYQAKIQCKDGSVKDVEVSAGAIQYQGRPADLAIARDVTERNWAMEELRRRNEELAALNAIANTLGRSLDVDEIMNRALEEVLNVMGLANGVITLLDEHTGGMVLATYAGLSEQFVQNVRERGVGSQVTQIVTTGPQTVSIENLWTDPLVAFLKKDFQTEGLRSGAAVPLRSKDRLLGMLAVISREFRQFSAEDLELLTSIGSQIAMAIENASLYQQQLRRLSEMEVLRKTTLDISRQLEVPQLLRSTVERAVALMGTKGGGLYLYDRDAQELELVVSHYLDQDYTGTRLKVGEGLSGRVALTGEPQIVEDYSKWEGRSEKYEGAAFRGILAVPLKWGENIIGVLNVTDVGEPRSFSDRHLRLLELFASQAAIAIENARLHDETKRRLEELSAIEEIVDELSSALDFRRVIELVLEKAMEATHTPVGAIAVVDEERTELLLVAHRGYPVGMDAQREWRWSIEAGIVGRVVRSGELSVVDDVSQDPDYAELVPETRSQLTLPILGRERVAGAIVLESPQLAGFTQEHAAFIQHLAEHAAVAMDNAQLYERLKESEERYRAYVENVPDAIWETDAHGRYTYWSPQIENLTGYTPEDLVGQTPYEFLIYPDDVQESKNTVQQMFKAGREEYTLRHRALHRDGSILHIEVSVKPVRDETGRVIKYRGVARDVSDRVRLQAQLIQSAKLSGIGQMISGVAHELNNPLTTVMGYAQLLQAADVDEEVKSDLQTVYNDALRAQRIVQNLLTFARQKKPQRSPVDVNEVIERTLALRRYQLEVDNVEIVTELAENLPWTSADSYQLQQVFLNIINNAHQAMLQQEGRSILTIRSQLVDGDTIRVGFADTGPGIPPDVLDKVFDPFFTTKEVGLGTGLGLSVSHGIVEEHQGRIWVESQLGQGATFFVELPVRSWVEDIPTPLLSEESEELAPQRRSALVIDDDRGIVDLIVRMLRDSGYRADGATSAQLALDRLHREKYDVIISDIKMPNMDGPACEKEIRKMDPALAERIIFITGDILSPTTQAFLDQWEGRRIQKPFDAEKLIAVVQEVLS